MLTEDSKRPNGSAADDPNHVHDWTTAEDNLNDVYCRTCLAPGMTARNPTPPQPALRADPGYTLTPGERNVFASINQQILQAKLSVYNLNATLEKQLKEVERLEAQFGGALMLIANSHGMSQAQITPDFTRIDPPKEQR
jgi:hypothetical protein